MADVAAAFRSWSATAGSNSPSGSTVIGSGVDDNLRQIQATIRQYLASQASNMVAAATVDLSTADGYYINITGATTITAFGTESAGISYLLKFASTPVITHNGTSLILPGAANITAAAGDLMLVVSEGSGNWRCAWYQQATSTPAEKLPTTKGDILAATASQTLARVGVGADGTVLTANASAAAGVSWATPASITLGTEQATTSGTAIDFTVPSGTKRIVVMFKGVSTNGTSNLLLQIGPSGGVESTGYSSSASFITGAYPGAASAAANSTAGFIINSQNNSPASYSGAVNLFLENPSSYSWVSSGLLSDYQAVSYPMHHSAGSKSAAAEVVKLRLTTVGGTDAFDAGAVNIQYQ